MRRGEIWWARLPHPVGRRPVLLLSRDEAYDVRDFVTVAPVTTRLRGIRAEVPLGPAEGVPRPCAVNLDSIQTIPKDALDKKITSLPGTKVSAVESAIRFALAIGPP